MNMDFLIQLQFRKLVKIAVYYLLPISLFGLIIFVPQIKVFSKVGSLAFLILTTVLFIKPLSILTDHKLIKILMTYRRQMGLAVFWLYLGHSMGLMAAGRYTIDQARNSNSFMFWGLLAGMGLGIMALTSNDLAIKVLKRNWKQLHKIVYVIYFLVLYHSSLAGQNPSRLWIFGTGFVVLKIWENLKVRQRRKQAVMLDTS